MAPDVTNSGPKIISSATLPPMHTSMWAIICCLVVLYSSLSGTWLTMPSAWPLGMMVALWMGLAPGVYRATSACPPSWYAVSRRASWLCDRARGDPISILSLASSRQSSVIRSRSLVAAIRAASFTMLNRSAPEKPGVRLASSSESTSDSTGLLER